jgi:hypothetical protein
LAKKEYFETVVLKNGESKEAYSTYGIDLLKKYVSSVQGKIDADKKQSTQGDEILSIKR